MLRRAFPFSDREPLRIPPKYPVDPDIRLHYPFHEASGEETVHDFSGYGLHGTLINAPTWVSGKPEGQYGPALGFNGINQYVYRPDYTASPLDISTEVTLQAWVYLTADQAQGDVIIQKYHAYQLMIWPAPRMPRFVIYDGAWVICSSAVNITLFEWHLLQGTYDGANLNLYSDLALLANTPHVGTIQPTNNHPLDVGGFRTDVPFLTGNFFTGYIDEPMVIAKALDAEERQRAFDSRMRRNR